MAERIQKTKATSKEEAKQVEEVKAADTKTAEELLAETEALFADIDEALGENLENAQEFVASFQQKGGQ